MGWWEERVVPRMVDAALKGKEIGELRGEVCAPLSGRVLELGFGSGLNIRWYPQTVTAVHAVEPSDRGWELSARRRARSSVPIVRSGLDGQDLAEDDASYDAVLCTFTLCTIPDPARALRESVRVLRPGGTFAFLEHGLAPDAGVARWQRRLDPVQRRVAGGCHLSRDVAALVADAGLRTTTLTTEYLPGPRPSRPWLHGFRGLAVRD
ncbi:class I SAM-dependent methyltransferase [Nocardioides caeni]|uniref:Class I SAM-dependent methyltransferase n=1 Tax=Nocardioides caeni TaxID=574700 RepID=A0A4S8N4U2_9ACTN|nr:class I SAM-dependent methyltransferase [Nocardioides caeni]THV11163.1 class I SAM-dependent methyltransferase [Nocardioides caeni]